MKKKVILAAYLLSVFSIASAQSQIKSEANGPVSFNTTGHDLQLQDNGSNVTLKLKNSTSDPGALFKLNANGNLIIDQKNSRPLIFKSAGSESMRILDNGNIGVGLTNPSEKLSVAGTIESTTGGIKFPDGTVQATAASNSTSPTFTDLDVTGRLKVGPASIVIEQLFPLNGTNHIYTTAGSGDMLINSTDNSVSEVPHLPANTILNANNNIGNVGVGTTAPTAKLDLALAAQNYAEVGMRITAPGLYQGSTTLPLIPNPNSFEIRRATAFGPPGFNTHFVVEAAGNVGIGIDDPVYRLHVKNPSTNAGTALRVDAVNGHIRLFETDENPQSFTQIERNGNGFHIYQRVDNSTPFQHVFHADMIGNVAFGANTNPDAKMLVENSEKTVGLCVNNTQSANYGYGVKCIVNNNTTKSLAVVNTTDNLDVFRVMGDGVVWCTELNVDVKGDFPDYVFEESYDLMPLDDLQIFIQKEKHLPNIPTAVDVGKNGIAVSEMAVKQTEKIEELTLYILQLHDSVKQLSEQNTELQKRIVELESK